MGSRFTALLIALAMVAPTAAIVGGLPCEARTLVMASCCCDTADEPAPAAPSVEATCCCSVEQAPATPRTSYDGVLHASSAPEAPAAALLTPAPFAIDPAPAAELAVAQARAPPPARTLLSQRTSFLC